MTASWSGEPLSGEADWTDFGELGLTIDGDATAGDRIEIHTEIGLVETAVE